MTYRTSFHSIAEEWSARYSLDLGDSEATERCRRQRRLIDATSPRMILVTTIDIEAGPGTDDSLSR